MVLGESSSPSVTNTGTAPLKRRDLSDGQLRDGQLRDGQLRDGQLRDGQLRDGQPRSFKATSELN
jgi:hypothetical protein